MNNRIWQIRALDEHKRNTFSNQIIEQNSKNINNFEENILKEYILKYLENLTQKDIKDIFYKLKIYWVKVDKSLSLTKIFYKILTNNILLPNYLEKENKEKIFEELDKIIFRLQNKTTKDLENMQKNWFLNLNFSDLYPIFDEYETSWYLPEVVLHFWWIFWIVSIETLGRKFIISVPIRIAKKQKVWQKWDDWLAIIKQEELKKVLDKHLDWKWEYRYFKKKFYENIVSVETKIDNNKWNKYWFDEDSKYQILDIYIENKDLNDYLEEEEIENILASIFQASNLLLNDIVEKSQVKHKKRFINYSNFLEKIEEDNENTLDENSKILEEFWLKKSDVEKMERDFKVKIWEKVNLKDVWWQEKAKQEVEKIIKSIKFKEIMQSWGARTTSGIIFKWPSWTWKTLLAKSIASELDAEIYNVKLTSISSDAYINTGSNNIKNLFSFIRYREKLSKWKKIIVILDELDALFPKRWWANQSGEDTKIVNTFLTEMSWLENLENVILIWTTNLIENIDSAVIRSGRMTTHVEVWLPDEKWLEQIYQIHINKAKKKSKKFEEIMKLENLDEIIKKSKWLSGADVEEIIRIILENKALEEISWNQNIEITEKDFFDAIWKIEKKQEKRRIWF